MLRDETRTGDFDRPVVGGEAPSPLTPYCLHMCGPLTSRRGYPSDGPGAWRRRKRHLHPRRPVAYPPPPCEGGTPGTRPAVETALRVSYVPDNMGRHGRVPARGGFRARGWTGSCP